jgi:hypothetical protein
MKTRSTWLRYAAFGYVVQVAAAAATATLHPVADTFLLEGNPDHSAGGQSNVAAGTVSNGTRMRALLRFDVASGVPAGATVTAVSLGLTATRVIAGGGVNSTFELRRVLGPWTEDTHTGNLGLPAAAGETCWTHRRYPDTPWHAPGGAIGTDYASNGSGSAAVAGPGGYQFASSPAMVADAQLWLDKPDTNFGWVLMTTQEAVSETARRFASREDAARAPVLTIEYATREAAFRISGVSVSGDRATIAWTNGRPSYQVQMRSGLSEAWVNVGPATEASTASVPVEGQQAFFRVVQDATARFQVRFDATWSPETHPASYPAGSSHWSGLVGGVHNERVHFWREGEAASEGIRMMAELGSQPRLLSEVNAAAAAGDAQFTLSGGGINPSPGTRVLVFPQPMRREFPLVTLCSMIAPSPDWFVGVDSVSLIDQGRWVTNKAVTLYGFDAGTDSGAIYTSADQATLPRGVVTRFAGFPALVDGAIVPFGTFTFTRLD